MPSPSSTLKTFLCLVLLLTAIGSSVLASPVWLIEKHQQRLYIAGTVHLLRSSDYPLPTAFEKGYQQSQHLVFEIDIAESKKPAFQQKMVSAMRLPPNDRLSDKLHPDTLQRLEAQLERNGMSLALVDQLNPSMVAMTLTLLELRKLGANGQGVDEFFYAQAIRDGKSTSALETAEDQITMLANLSNGLEDDMMRQTLDELDSLHGDFEAMINAWRAGDRRRLNTLFIQPMRDSSEKVYQSLLVERNLLWLEQIERMLESEPTEMVLVGSGHLIGDDGLLQQLKKKGFRVEQLD